MSAGIVYNNGTALTATAAGNAGEVLTSQGAGSPPIFAAAGGGGSINAFSAVYTADQLNMTGNNTSFILIPDTTLVSNGFSYNNTTGLITVNNTGIFSITATLLLNGINESHNLAQWLVYAPGPSYLTQSEPGNLMAYADDNGQFTTIFNSVISLTASSVIGLYFVAYFGTKTIGCVNSYQNTNFITIIQIG